MTIYDVWWWFLRVDFGRSVCHITWCHIATYRYIYMMYMTTWQGVVVLSPKTRFTQYFCHSLSILRIRITAKQSRRLHNCVLCVDTRDESRQEKPWIRRVGSTWQLHQQQSCDEFHIFRMASSRAIWTSNHLLMLPELVSVTICVFLLLLCVDATIFPRTVSEVRAGGSSGVEPPQLLV